MKSVAFIPFLVQAVAMTVDEFYFHRRRGLPRWERIGHPLDTLTILACFGFVLVVPYSTNALWIYGALAVFSSIFVTKDEFIHLKHCSPAEQWLHSILFVLHPIVLFCAGALWPELGEPGPASLFFKAQFGVIVAFGFYQTIYWNLVRERSLS